MPKFENETINIVNYKGNKDKILLIHISPSINTLIRNVKDEVYLRQGDSTNKLSSEQVKIKDPSLFFPTARVRVIKFEGKEMQTGADLNIIKDKTFAMPLYKQIKESQKFVDTQLREFTHLGTDGEFVTVPEYPKFAWEERNN